MPLYRVNDAYVDFGAPAELQRPANSPFTFETWIRFDRLKGGFESIFSKNKNRGSPYSFVLGLNTNTLAAYDGGAYRGNLRFSRQVGWWYHLAYSYDGTNMAFYVDGELFGAAPFTYTNDATHTVKLGGYASTASIEGCYNEARFWDHARDAAQINHYLGRRVGGKEQGLLAYWPLTENRGTTAYDHGRNGLDGTYINLEWSADDALPER